MTRGKYANRADARRTREAAEVDAETYRRKVAQLVAENGKLRETLTAERAATSERMRRMAALMEESASPEVERLRRELDAAREAVASERRQAGLDLARLFRSRPDDTRLSATMHTRIMDLFHITPTEYFGDLVGDNRTVRRSNGRKMRSTNLVVAEFRARGAEPL